MWEVFERLCAERGITAADVSRATGIGQSTFANWKRRRNLVTPEIGIKIASCLGVSLEYLMTGIEREGYYENDDTARIAQTIHDQPKLRALFSAAADCEPETLDALYQMLNILKEAETRGSD